MYYYGYMLGVYILIASVVACIAVASLVLSQGVGEARVRAYAALTFTMLIMSIANYLAIHSTEGQLLYVRIVMATAIASLYLVYVLVRHIRPSRKKISIIRDPFLYITIAMTVFSMSPWLFSDIKPGNPPLPVATIGALGYFAFLALLVWLSVSWLGRGLSKVRLKKERKQFQLIIIGLLPIVILSPITSFILPQFGISQFVELTPLYVGVFVFFVGYAIIRHGLFDVRAAVVRGLVYALVLASLAGVYYVLAYGMSVLVLGGSVTTSLSVSPLNVVLALLLAFLFQPFKRFFDRVTGDLFYRDRYSTEDFYERLNIIIRSASSLRQLIVRSAELVKDTLKAESVSLFVLKGGSGIASGGTDGYRKMPVSDIRIFEPFRSPLYINDPSLPVEIRRLFVSYRIAVAVPLYRADGFVGLMCIGERRVSHFTHRDIRVLRAIAGELVVGTQNALAIQEIRDLNDNLQQRIDAATKELRRSNAQLQRLDETKDEFISMASHQLRTPLTSIKGYISMLIDGDLGKISAPQKQVLEEAFSSSERMVHLISDFLNVSRLQTGKFVIERRTTNLADLVESEVHALKQSAESRDLELRYVKPKNVPDLELDADKLRQVVMNFIDNAIYYSKSGTSIAVSLRVVSGWVEFKVKDTGIGVPEDEQAGLFSKFFRATNARRSRPDGTGVGLFLAKKVVTDHKGDVIFQSKEGKGSTFGFRLPIPPKSK